MTNRNPKRTDNIPSDLLSADVKPFDPLLTRKQQGLAPLPLITVSLKEQRRVLAKAGLREVRALSNSRDINGNVVTKEWITVENIPRKVEVEVVPYDREKDPESVFVGTLNNSVTYREITKLTQFYNLARSGKGFPVTYDDVLRVCMRGYRK